MKQVIFFDLDGTIIDTSSRHYLVYKDIMVSCGITNILSKNEFWNEKRKGKKTVELLPKNLAEEFIKKFMDEWLKRIEDKRYLKYDKLLPESLDVLSILKDNCDLILITLRNNRENLLWELNNFGLNKYFKGVLVDSPLKIKNKVSLIKDYVERNSENDNFIIVGDTEADIFAGKELGILTIAVTYGIRSKEFLMKLKPDFCFDNISKLPDILKRIGD